MKETALVTGASGGIGLETARVLAEKGSDLIMVARSGEKMEAAAGEFRRRYQVEVEVLVEDLSDRSSPPRVAERVRSRGCFVKYLVNNAGFGLLGSFSETDWRAESSMIDLNMGALTHLTKLFLPAMLERNEGRILNVASTAAFQPGPGMAVYFATKAYVLSFSEALAQELRGSSVTVTALCPGPTASDFDKKGNIENSAAFKGRKLATSAEVARFGHAAMTRGDRIAIHGTFNRLLTFSVRFLPRALVARVAEKVMAPKHG